ncbi:MAG: Uma2 family endonuclease [Acidobacteriota bacterium]|jgi:Uma2 family endonuclease|nr:Uma2 family endonuclease [Acidobacteriota bacterium]
MPLPEQERYTYSDYATWDDDVRYELIAGVPYLMSPAPTPRHQLIAGELALIFGSFLRGKPCKLISSPIDVRLNADTDDDTIVQPDLIVVCDKKKIGEKNIVGAPDLVVEVLSPSTETHDRMVKFALYRAYGVREYWVVDPKRRFVEVNLLENGKYIKEVYGDKDVIDVAVLPGLAVNLTEVFPEGPEDGKDAAEP